ncbi:MAG: peroxide stress protein YaaA [Mycobacteriales bacterium]
MLVLLPPSEGKATGRRGAPLDLEALSFPELTPVRRRLVSHVQALAQQDPDGLRTALGLTPRQVGAIEADATLRTAPTLPALQLYTGVLYDSLDYGTLESGAKRRANSSLVVASALFGLVRPRDRLPPYRLSGSSVLPGLGGLIAIWRPVLEPSLRAQSGLVVDLRSGAYAGLARVPGAVEVRVLRETAGERSVVSHDNKWTKGLLARALCERGARSVRDVAAAGRCVADAVEVHGRRIDLVLHGLATARPQTVSG